jgi:hypothetical protein
MMGSCTYGWAEYRAREGVCFGRNSSANWGGIPVVLTLGDPGQLPQVLEPSVWDHGDNGQESTSHTKKKTTRRATTPASLNGRSAFSKIKNWVWLQQVQRQKTNKCFSCHEKWHHPGSDCSILKDTLLKMRFGTLDESDYEWLKQWQLHNFSCEKRTAMNGGLWVFPQRHVAHEMNVQRLVDMNRSGSRMVYTRAQDKGPCSKYWSRTKQDGTTKDVKGLETKSVLCRGAKVSLTCNMYIPWKLFNGSQGEIVDIIYLDGKGPSLDGDSLPDFCMVHFPGYTGPPILPWDPKVVPVTPQEIFSDCHHHCSRTQIPLVANYARTIHKCQGITCGPGHVDEYFVTDLGEKSAESRWSGIAFVTLSRASVMSHLGTEYLVLSTMTDCKLLARIPRVSG